MYATINQPLVDLLLRFCLKRPKEPMSRLPRPLCIPRPPFFCVSAGSLRFCIVVQVSSFQYLSPYNELQQQQLPHVL